MAYSKPIYFDNAATTLVKPQTVIDAVNDAMQNLNVNYGRGQHSLASRAYSIVEETRELVLEMMGAYSKQVVFMPTATEALNIAIRCSGLKSGDTIYISPFEHNAVTRTVEHMVQKCGVQQQILAYDLGNGEWDYDQIEEQFKNNLPDIVVISQGSNVTGEVLPVVTITSLAKAVNPDCVTVLDMAQTAGHSYAEGNVANLETVDIAVFSGHKTLYAPFGASGMLVKPDLKLKPLIYGGTGFDSASVDMPESMPERFEVGSVNITALAGLNAAVKWRLADAAGIAQQEITNAKRLFEILQKLEQQGLWELVTSNEPDFDFSNHTGVFSVVPKDTPVDEFGHLLSEKNIQVRTGLHCAPLAHKTSGTYPAGTVRFSSNYFTSDENFRALEIGLGELRFTNTKDTSNTNTTRTVYVDENGEEI